MLTFRMVRQTLLFDLKWSICHAIERLLRKIDYTGNFYRHVVGLITRVHDDCRKICSLCTLFLLASGHINVSHSINQTDQLSREKEKCASLDIILMFHAVYFGFYCHLVNFFCFLRKLTTGRPWPRNWLETGNCWFFVIDGLLIINTKNGNRMILQFDYIFWRHGNRKKNTYNVSITTLFPSEERTSIKLLWFLKVI